MAFWLFRIGSSHVSAVQVYKYACVLGIGYLTHVKSAAQYLHLRVPSSFARVDRPLDIFNVLFEDFRAEDGSSSLKTVDKFTCFFLIVLPQLVALVACVARGRYRVSDFAGGTLVLDGFSKEIFFFSCAAGPRPLDYYRRGITMCCLSGNAPLKCEKMDCKREDE